jgi:hypothetical protein
VFWSNKTKGLKKIAKIGQSHLCLMEGNINFDINKLNRTVSVPVPSQDIDFQRHMSCSALCSGFIAPKHFFLNFFGFPIFRF